MKISAKIRAIFLIISTAFFVGLYITISTLSKKYVITMRKWVSRKILSINNISLEFQGEIDPHAQLIISNHQSMLDIMLIEILYSQRDVCFIAKKELFKIPFFGRAVRNPDMIALDRQNKKGLKKLLNETKKRIMKHRPVVIFPEGTRSTTSTFLNFKSGAAFIANNLELKVQPIVISNTKKIFSMKRLLLFPGKITLSILPTVQAGESHKDWLEETKQTMQEEYHRVS